MSTVAITPKREIMLYFAEVVWGSDPHNLPGGWKRIFNDFWAKLEEAGIIAIYTKDHPVVGQLGEKLDPDRGDPVIENLIAFAVAYPSQFAQFKQDWGSKELD